MYIRLSNLTPHLPKSHQPKKKQPPCLGLRIWAMSQLPSKRKMLMRCWCRICYSFVMAYLWIWRSVMGFNNFCAFFFKCETYETVFWKVKSLREWPPDQSLFFWLWIDGQNGSSLNTAFLLCEFPWRHKSHEPWRIPRSMLKWKNVLVVLAHGKRWSNLKKRLWVMRMDWFLGQRCRRRCWRWLKPMDIGKTPSVRTWSLL